MERALVRALALAVLLAACTASPRTRQSGASTTQPNMTSAPTTTLADDVVSTTAAQTLDVEVSAGPRRPGGIISRFELIAAYGFGLQRGMPRPEELPDLATQVPGLEVQYVQVSCCLDNVGAIVLADGSAEEIGDAVDLITPRAQRVVSGDDWLVAVAWAAHGYDWIDDLLAVVDRIMAPDTVCSGTRWCPAGSEYGFPSPPPVLAVNTDHVEHQLPFDLVFMGPDVSSINPTSRSGGLSWVEAGHVRAGWLRDRALEDVSDCGPGEWVRGFGGWQLVIGGTAGQERLRYVDCPDHTPADSWWRLPPGVDETSAAIVGAFQKNDYRLIVAVDGTARALPVSLSILGATQPVFGAPIERAEIVNPADASWSVLRAHAEGLAVVEQRGGRWRVLTDALGAQRALVESNLPIVDFDIAPGGDHVVVAVESPSGVTNWWVHQRGVVELPTSATSLVWLGTHDTP